MNGAPQLEVDLGFGRSHDTLGVIVTSIVGAEIVRALICWWKVARARRVARVQELEQRVAAAGEQNAADRESFKEEMGRMERQRDGIERKLQESLKREEVLRGERLKTPSSSQPRGRLATPVPASEQDLAKAVNEVLLARDEFRSWKEGQVVSEQKPPQELGETRVAEGTAIATPQREDPEATSHLARQVELIKDHAGGRLGEFREFAPVGELPMRGEDAVSARAASTSPQILRQARKPKSVLKPKPGESSHFQSRDFPSQPPTPRSWASPASASVPERRRSTLRSRPT